MSVVVWQAEVEDEADGPESKGDGNGDAGESGTVGYEVGGYDAVQGQVGELGAPEPEGNDIELLGALDYAGAEGPGRCRNATCGVISGFSTTYGRGVTDLRYRSLKRRRKRH